MQIWTCDALLSTFKGIESLFLNDSSWYSISSKLDRISIDLITTMIKECYMRSPIQYLEIVSDFSFFHSMIDSSPYSSALGGLIILYTKWINETNYWLHKIIKNMIKIIICPEHAILKIEFPNISSEKWRILKSSQIIIHIRKNIEIAFSF